MTQEQLTNAMKSCKHKTSLAFRKSYVKAAKFPFHMQFEKQNLLKISYLACWLQEVFKELLDIQGTIMMRKKSAKNYNAEITIFVKLFRN